MKGRIGLNATCLKSLVSGGHHKMAGNWKPCVTYQSTVFSIMFKYCVKLTVTQTRGAELISMTNKETEQSRKIKNSQVANLNIMQIENQGLFLVKFIH